VVPIKGGVSPKQRLEAIFAAEERRRIALAMAEDVLCAVGELREYARFVVTSDDDVAGLADRFDLTLLADREQQGQSAAVRQGFVEAWALGYSAALTVPGDVPAVTPSDLRALATYRPEVEVLLVPDREATGTNALRAIPPHAITMRFGEDSLSLHRAEAERAGRSLEELTNERIACDLDRPADVAAFLELAPPTATLRLLHALGARERVASLSRPRV
jgi:2-phospho-L-lactate guanylyltransferase